MRTIQTPASFVIRVLSVLCFIVGFALLLNSNWLASIACGTCAIWLDQFACNVDKTGNTEDGE